MAQGVHTEKVPGGKLLRIKVDFNPEDGIVEDVQMHGDFFIHPEEFVEDIEQLLVNLDQKDSEESIAAALQRLIEDEGAELVGIAPESIAKAFKTALSNAITPPPLQQ
ncbi:biotin--protein ligase [Candidatus Woesearchaeota archaeon]|nr:biotin--protein ligase [Candidatus Woesearchaeota archaeon]